MNEPGGVQIAAVASRWPAGGARVRHWRTGAEDTGVTAAASQRAQGLRGGGGSPARHGARRTRGSRKQWQRRAGGGVPVVHEPCRESRPEPFLCIVDQMPFLQEYLVSIITIINQSKLKRIASLVVKVAFVDCLVFGLSPLAPQFFY
jgi:hypothetical protein